MGRRTSFATASAALVLAVTLGGCSSAAKTSQPTPAQRLATAEQKFAAAKSVSLTLSSTGVPPKVNGVTAAQGVGIIDATTPSFKGQVTGTVKGLAGNLDLIAIGSQTWMKFFTPGYNPVNLADLGAPNPALLFNSKTGVPSLLAATTGPVAGDRTRDGREVLNAVTGSLPGAPIKALLKLGDGKATFTVSYGITDAGELRTAVITGPFYAGSTSTYNLTVKDYGTPVAIDRP